MSDAPMSGADPAGLGEAAVAAGAHPGEVDAGALLAEIRALQERLNAVEGDKRQEVAPEVVKYAAAAAGHMAALAAANPHLAAHPDFPMAKGPVLAAAAAEAAKAEAAGTTGALAGPAQEFAAWLKVHAARWPHLDFGYIAALVDDAVAAAKRLA